MADQDKDQKTEEATPRRLQEARQEGQVAISSELMAALGLVVGLGSLVFTGGPLASAIGGLTVDVSSRLGVLGRQELDPTSAAGILESSIRSVIMPLLLVMLPAIAISVLGGYLQVGFQITPKAMALKLSKINPIQGWSKLFGLRGVMRTVMASAKILLITSVVVLIAWFHVDEIMRVGTNELGPLLSAVGTIVLRCLVGGLAVILLLAIIDLLYQRFQHARDMRMSKQEVKDEHKLSEGDPHVRARIRQVQREMATRRMMADVPDATVVVTNPTHYAVALRYERDALVERAPMVVAKGTDELAQRIKKVASENDVPLYEDVPLARALHAQVEVGEEIPEELYAAVAAVLGYVYRMQGERGASVR